MARLIEARPGRCTDRAYLDAISGAAAVIRKGGLVAFPTETVYGLGADGLNEDAVARVYAVKERPPESALILHLASSEQASEFVREVPEVARRLMRDFWPGPLTLVLPKSPAVPAITAGGRANIAVRVPAHPVALDFIRACGCPVVGPSANKSGHPSPITPEDVLAELGDDIDAVLDGGPAPLGMESTVLDLTVDPPDIVRPGSVTAEQLLPYLGRLRSPALKSDPERWAGARRRESRLVLVDVAPGPRAAQRIWNLAMTGLESGRRPGLLMTTEGAAEMAGERGLDADSRASARESAPESPSAASAAPAPGAAARSPALVLVTRGGIPVAVLGPRGEPGAIAASLYAGLRALEGLGCNLILAEPVPRTGLGVAVMDRLEKAAAEVVSR